MKNTAGYTLVELMVVVAIVGIIAAVAYPSYQGYMRDTFQAQAVADLRLCALSLDRYYSNGFTYVGAPASTCTMYSPSDGPVANKKFDLSFVSLTQTNYTIRATPVNDGDCIQLVADGTQSACP